MPPTRLAVQGPRHHALVRPLRHRDQPARDDRGLPGPGGSRADGPLPAHRPPRRVAPGLDHHALDPHLERGGGGGEGSPLRPRPAGRGQLLAGPRDPEGRPRGPLRGDRGAAGRRPGRLALRRPLRRPAGGPGGVREGDPRGARARLPAAGGGLGRGRRGRGDGDRPYRPGLRRRGLPAGQAAGPAGHRPARRVGLLHRRVRGAQRPRRPRRDRADRGASPPPPPVLPPGADRPSLSALLAVRDAARLPARRRVVHQHGRGLRPGPRDAHHRAGRAEPALPDHGRGRWDPLDPGLRLRARARLAPQHARLDDQQEALLGPRPADLRLHCLRDDRRGRRSRRAPRAGGRGLG